MKTTTLKLAAQLASATLLASVLTACSTSDSSTNNDPNPDPDSMPENQDESSVKSVVVNASAGGFGAAADDPTNKYTYFSFTAGEVVELTDDESESSSDWHIAFKRTKTKLNGGVSGPGGVSGTVGDLQSEYYDTEDEPISSVFLNVTTDDELASLEAVTSDSGLTYQQDENVPEIPGDGGEESWFSYDFSTHAITANTRAWNIVRGAAGDSFAQVRVTDIVQASRDITLEMYIQSSGETAFDINPTEWNANIGADGGSLCYDFDTAAEVVCADNEAIWDLQVEVTADGRTWNMWTNGGIKGEGTSGAKFGTVAPESIGNYASAAEVPGFFADAPSGVFLDSNWYAYSLQGQHKIYPNYRVYIANTGSEKYKFQITSYYDATEGTSGVLSLRYAPFTE